MNAGALTAERALRRAVRKLDREGIGIIAYQNRETGTVTVENRVDVAVRRHVRTQIAQDGARMTMERMERLGVTLVEVSSHCDSRPDHRSWQGRCYSLVGDVEIDGTRYPDFYASTQYGSVSGLMGANCRHSFGSYRHGAPRAYEPDPRHPSGLPGEEVYRLEQRQRYLERRIRAAKREVRGAQQAYDALGGAESHSELARAKEALKSRQAAMRGLIADANAASKTGAPVLHRKPAREWAGDMPRVAKMGAMRHDEPLVKMTKTGRNSLSVSPVVNTKGCRDAFEGMPLPKATRQALYEQAGRILSATDGTEFGHLAAVDARTGAPVADNLDAPPARERATGFRESDIRKIRGCANGVVTIHNHPGSMQPSYRDVVTAAENDEIKASVIVGHDGSVWYVAVDDPSVAGRLTAGYNALKDSLGDMAEHYALRNLLDKGCKMIDWRKLR